MDPRSMGEETEPANEFDEDRRAHLQMIQSAVSRMAGASSSSKSWLLPVVSAAYGYALTKNAESAAVVGIGATMLFAVLDAQYLRQERAFRALFRRAVEGSVPVYDMNNRAYYGKPNDDEEDTREENCRWPSVIFSWSLGGFYGPAAGAGLLILARVMCIKG